MQEKAAVIVKDLRKEFKLPHEQHSGIKQLLLSARKRKKGYEVQKVLDNISFDIKQGEFFGIVGRNGSGKSTLLKLLAGIYVPDDGLVQVNGSLTPFIELGVGFNPELTGRENVFMNGALLGFGKGEMEAMYDDIVSFAELERFMDQKLKNYSSGMQVRLAFSIAIRAQTDILLLDEVLAVGDAVFQRKCYTYFKELKKKKKTVIFVSHDTGALQEYCDRAALIDKGKLLAVDDIETILDKYAEILSSDQQKGQESKYTAEIGDTSKKAYIKDIQIILPTNQRYYTENQDIELSVNFHANIDIETPVYGITISDAAGTIMFQSNTLWRKTPVRNLAKDEEVKITWRIPNAFNSGVFSIEPGIASSNGLENYHRVAEAASFEVVKKQKSHGYINALHDIIIE